MAGLLAVLYGVVAYGIFFATFLYAIAFIGNMPVPKTVDSGVAGPVGEAVLVNLVLLTIFAAQHSIMARPGFKRAWTRLVPPAVERSTYVLFASLALMLLLAHWQPIPDVVWSVQNPIAVAAIQTVFWFGWVILFLATFLINHFELFGLSQVFRRLLKRDAPPPKFKTPLLYRYVRHPIYLGFLLSFWAAPTMSAGHLLFAAATTGYVLLGIFLEERDLVAVFGDQYRHYRAQVAMLVPVPGRALREPVPPVPATADQASASFERRA